MKKGILATIILGVTLSCFAPAANAFAATSNGWENTNGTWYYYENGVKSTSKWVQGQDGKWYYVGADGAMEKNAWAQGQDGKWYYVGADGAMEKNEWAQGQDGKWYYVGADGAMEKNAWAQGQDGKWYYVGKDGAMLTNQWIHHTDGKDYYVGNDGAMLQDTYTPDGYYVDENGVWDGQPASNGQAIVEEAKKHIGKPYKWEATGPDRFDCSGFTQYVYLQVTGRDITRTTYTQVNQGTAVSRDSLRAGDLIFFNNTSSDGRNPSHVGIYIGDNEFIHASSSKGVTISSLSNSYYDEHYGCARRIL